MRLMDLLDPHSAHLTNNLKSNMHHFSKCEKNQYIFQEYKFKMYACKINGKLMQGPLKWNITHNLTCIIFKLNKCLKLNVSTSNLLARATHSSCGQFFACIDVGNQCRPTGQSLVMDGLGKVLCC